MVIDRCFGHVESDLTPRVTKIFEQNGGRKNVAQTGQVVLIIQARADIPGNLPRAELRTAVAEGF